MREVEVVGVRVEMPSNQPIVLLRESSGERYLPIWIGAVEATAIAFAQQGVVPPRPLTHDLLKDVIDATGNDLAEIRITEVHEGVYYATLAFASGVEVSARPSDSIALALRTGTRIVCAEDLLETSGLAVGSLEESDEAGEGSGSGEPISEGQQEDEVERFREFLDQVTPEDFEEEGPSTS
ncbi:bifunctional nuclease family protein [Nocardioides mangrovicus]|uniref:Bifunctional nuclease family protein n=1 Tax=Nocardioides mangrovicus TaxID=2478913 RepID=A0A3L8P1E8_9ACTN|nr:bifunctional nuclease family protein [Nocardioides mangrovicus]RLV48653.1 bifunctional nuclease family protein [Nocardioides mangrovicus]